MHAICQDEGGACPQLPASVECRPSGAPVAATATAVATPVSVSASSSSSSSSKSTDSNLPSSYVVAVERAFSALVGYSFGAVVVLPLDRLKTLMQASSAETRVSAVSLARQVCARQGFPGLFQGWPSHMIIAPYTIFYFSVTTRSLRAMVASIAWPLSLRQLPRGH